MKSEFYYRGRIPSSKSILNRLLICKSFSPSLEIIGDSTCDDVVLMKQAVSNILDSEFECGSAGTVLRFLACRLSREKKSVVLKGSERLFSRPQKDLLEVFDQLGVIYEFGKDNLKIVSGSWHTNAKPIFVDRSKSSQFLSGLILSSWDLSEEIVFHWGESVVSDGYLQMTLECVSNLGMQFELGPNSIKIPAAQKISKTKAFAESDLSSAFAIAAIAGLAGEAHFIDFPNNSLQPDRAFVDILSSMNIPMNFKDGVLSLIAPPSYKACRWSLNDCPDLFPVLAVFCSQAVGQSELYGAPHLGFKESDRLGKSAELLKKMGKTFEIIDGGMRITGSPSTKTKFSFDTDEDHRLAFAAGLAQYMGYEIELSHSEVVAKSFPEYWDIIRRSS